MFPLMVALHFLADGLLQPRWMGIGKSSDRKILTMHLSIICIVMFIGLLFVTDVLTAGIISTVNAIVHGLIDATIWNAYKAITKIRLVGIGHNNIGHQQRMEIFAAFKYWEDKLFYDIILFDQTLHILTLWYVMKYFV